MKNVNARGLFLLVIETIILATAACVPVPQSSSDHQAIDELILEDCLYEPEIHSARVFPIGSNTDVEGPAVAMLRKPMNLILEFDDLKEEAEDYYAFIVHCNVDWSRSSLTDLEFMADFNEFAIDQYEYSFNAKTPYVSYRFILPRVKLPGNYLLVVYRNPNKDDLVLSKRFIVVDDMVQIAAKAGISAGIEERRTHHQIEFEVNYGKYEILNPHQDIRVVIRQNYQWFNAISNLKPTLIREDLSQLAYNHFNLENNFMAGNEYRYFDLRSVSFLGLNVAKIAEDQGRLNAFLLKDSPRRGAYSAYEDLNGKYVLQNMDPQKSHMQSEYVKVHFFLALSDAIPQEIYIMGELSNWSFNETNRMTYDSELKGYIGSLLLKQGWYNYLYYVPDAENPFLLEGNHYETENVYEIIVYHRPPGSRADLIIGYRSIPVNL